MFSKLQQSPSQFDATRRRINTVMLVLLLIGAMAVPATLIFLHRGNRWTVTGITFALTGAGLT